MKIFETQPDKAVSDDLIHHGYAEKHPHEITVCFSFTKEQLGTNTVDYDLYNTVCNEYMSLYMERISKKARCYQYENKEKLSYSDDWDLFFYHDSGENKKQNSSPQMDYFYFTLTFNRSHPKTRKEALLKMVMDVLKEYNVDGVHVTICYIAKQDEAKIRKDAEAIAPTLIGRYVQYKSEFDLLINPISAFSGLPIPPMEGRVVRANGQYYFMKKRARNRGYLLKNEDILRISWSMKED